MKAEVTAPTTAGHVNPNTLNGGPGTPGIDLDPINQRGQPRQRRQRRCGRSRQRRWRQRLRGAIGDRRLSPPGCQPRNGRAIITFQYGTSITLSTATATPLFGHAVTVTAAVASADPGAGTPTGSVAFSDRTSMLATVPLNNGQATFSTTKFQPGDHAITATYSGDPVFTASTTGAPAIATVGFSRPCITDHDGPLTVAADQSLCIAPGGRQNGPVELRPGGAPALSGTEINGPVSSDGALAVTICHSTLDAPVILTSTSGFMLLGDGEGVDCPGNTFRPPLTLDRNTGGLEVSSTTMSAPVTTNDNGGSGLLPEALVPEFEGNRVGAPLHCAGNLPTLRKSGNTLNEPHIGQCK